MQLTHRRVALAHLALAIAGFVVLVALACEPWPEPATDAERCQFVGSTGAVVTIDVAPDSAPCFFAKMRISRFVEVFRGKPGFDVERIRGVTVMVADGADGQAFISEGCSCDAGGDATCGLKRIRLASVHLHNLVHELAHIAENCPTDEDAGTRYAQRHPQWEERGVYVDIIAVENG